VIEISVSQLKTWAKKGSLAVLDQALFSGANFLVNILLARWLPPEEYGAFAVALSIYYLLLGFHTAVITEPMSNYLPILP
jgi:O-antigen/teichoic acid export membrane protein